MRLSPTTVVDDRVAAQILAQVAASDGSPRALDHIASEHGLFLTELHALLATQPTTKVCTKCQARKQLDEFYDTGRDGHLAQCIACNNDRPHTENRVLRNRARSRAYARLAKAHKVEFAHYMGQELAAAAIEHEQLKAAAAGNHDAPAARLKRGPRRAGETSAVQRLDVARCTSCHTHHDAAHECPNCGDTTPVGTPDVKPYEVRVWAAAHGFDVPARGRIPSDVVEHYRAAHEVAS